MSDLVEQRTYYTHRGSILYTPRDPVAEKLAPAQLPEPPFRRRLPRPSSIHITRFPAGYVFCVPPDPTVRRPSRLRVKFNKLASKETAKRVFGSVFSSFTAPFSAPPQAPEPIRLVTPEPQRSASISTEPSAPLPPEYDEPRPRPHSIAVFPPGAILDPVATMSAIPSSRGMSALPPPRNSISSGSGEQRNSISGAATRPQSLRPYESEKPLASASGITMAIQLAEPHVYLTGFDHDGRGCNSTQNTTAMIRGKLTLNVTKAIKIKAVTLSFCGKARTEWPEGIPPAKSEYFEEKKLRYQVLPFYNAAYENSEDGYGAQCKYTLRNGMSSMGSSLSNGPSTPTGSASTRSSRSSTLLSAKDQKRLSLQQNQSRSFSKTDSPSLNGPSAQQKGYKVFHPGTYEYSFELSLDHTSPETIELPLGSVKWMLEALVERAGTFKPNLHGTKEVLVIRAPDQNSLEQVEPIAISRKWEDQLHYDIVISGKSFPIGSKIPIAFKLTPLAKVQCHRIKVYVTENCDYFTDDKKVTRRDAQRKILLFEQQAGKPIAEQYKKSDVRFVRGGEPGPDTRERTRNRVQKNRARDAQKRGTNPEPLAPPTENLLGDIDLGLEELAVATEIEMDVQLPTCAQMRKERSKMIHPDTTWKLIQVHHWIKIVMRLSRLDTDDPSGTKRRHFEISIDSPFHILSCLATHQHTALPEYSSAVGQSPSHTFECGCPNAARTGDSSAGSSSGEVPTLDGFAQAGATGVDLAAQIAPPPQAHLPTNAAAGVQRPMHMLRAPSFNPPAFDEDEPPPPLPTPPPGYDMVVGTPSHDGLADYFARLADVYSDDDHTDEDEDVTRALSRNGRVNVVNPRTPGARTPGRMPSRSMDIGRDFMFRPEGFDSRLRQARNEVQTAI